MRPSASSLRRLAPVFACLLAAQVCGASEVDYERDVKPLLAKRCVGCHGAKNPRGGLRLDTAAAALKGGDAGPSVVPGQPEESALYLAVIGEGFTERMPLKRPPLTDGEIAVLRDWIAAGARYPEHETPSVATFTHWAFEPPRRPEPPEVRDPAWCRNPIDRFILERLDRDGLTPSPEADRATLIRRVSLDLTGLPPTPEVVAAFESDDRPDAYERVVDRLLASPRFGERWGRTWLDLARYADSNGYSIDAPRSIWKYRDWVIDALNHDLPFDEFTIDQLAGDLRDGASLDSKIATGFHRNTPINQEGGIDVEQFRVESVIDRVNTTGTVWLGLTIGCVQCHDHKYDPISQREYYGLFAFFNNADEPELPVATPEEVARQDQARAKEAEYLASVERDPELLRLQKAWEDGLDMVARQKQSQEVREAFGTPFDQRTAEINRPIFAAFIEQSKERAVAAHRQALAAIRATAPKITTTMVVRERATPRATRLLLGGDYTRPGEPVGPGVPEVLPPLDCAPGVLPNRLDLARWLIRPDHPLTARVTVNRLWQSYFGRGLVETENDFGTQGTPPSHPELLDWLATELVGRGWSLKALHRTIVTSATYRQASHHRPDLASRDPENRLLARQARLRLDAELVRDAALAVSGLLSEKIGGPSVFPPQPAGVMELGQMRREWKAETGPDRYRRGMYTFYWRATPHPLFTLFDAPDGTRTCTRRPRSNTPLQALMLLNDEAFVECAQALAERVALEAPDDPAGKLSRAFRLVLGRAPSDREASRLGGLLGGDSGPDWFTIARVLLNLDEFLTRE